MTDIIDRANIEAEAWLENKLHQVTKSQMPNDVTECIDCGEDIGEKRKQVLPHAVRCIKCQSDQERGKK